VVRAATRLALVNKRDWVRRLNQFAQRYFGGKLRQTTHALKDVSLFKLWTDLQRDTKPVDYSKMRYEVAATPQPDSACAGGACQTSYA
jgi:hypothetical protein